MFVELVDDSTGGQWVYRIIASADYEDRVFVLLQKTNLDAEAELYELIDQEGEIKNGDSIQPVTDEVEWREIIASIKSKGDSN